MCISEVQGGTAKPIMFTNVYIYLKLKSHKIVLCLCHFFEAFKLIYTMQHVYL